jgi:hypothetical protein
MSTDALDLPFQRPTHAPAGAGQAPTLTRAGNLSLNAEHLLLAEFTHASVVAYQVNEERGSLLNHYLVLTGVIATAAGVAASVSISAHKVGPLLAVIAGLILASVVSFAFFMRLIEYSHKYDDALSTMNRIKEFYIRELKHEMPHLHHAFRWRHDVTRRRKRTGSTTLLTGLIIAIMGSFCIGAAAELLYYFTHGFNGWVSIPLYLGSIKISGFLVDAPAFGVVLLLHLVYYRHARHGPHVRHVMDGMLPEPEQV